MVAQLVEDFFHLEGGEDVLDQHRALHRTLGYADERLRLHKDIVPETRFEIVLHLRQVKVDAGALIRTVLRVVEKIHRKVKNAARGPLTIH